MAPEALARWTAEFAVPEVLASREEMLACHERIHAALREPPAQRLPLRTLSEVRDKWLFYLAYHGIDVRALLEDFARLCRESCPELSFCAAHAGTRRPARARRKLRIGFLSQYLFNHTVASLFAGVITHFDRERFEVLQLQFPNTTSKLIEAVKLFRVPSHLEALARITQPAADETIILPPNLRDARTAIAALELDILFYLDLGMNSPTYFLAFSRLAPIQCTSWGHPITSGLPSIDYFVSSADLEPPGAQASYTETLMLLDNLPTFYERPAPPREPKSRADFGFDPRAHVYLCPQSLFKLHVDFDDLLLGILDRDPLGEIVLLESPPENRAWQEALSRRFRRTLQGRGSRIRFVPRQTSEGFLQLTSTADVLLDPVHFGGGKTTYEALALGIPIVTHAGRFMRGRVTSACYRQMGIGEAVAPTLADYAETAVRLGTEPEVRDALRTEILERNSVLFENRDAVRELGERLAAVAP